MRVVVVHHRYSSRLPSGENRSVDEHVALMRAAGIDVHVVESSNDELLTSRARSFGAMASAAIATPSTVRKHVRAVLASNPDVVHLENLVPAIPESLPQALAEAGIPVIRRWRSTRFVCAAGTLFRDGHGCRECVGRALPTPAVRHACYADSRIASGLVAFRRGSDASGVLHVPTSDYLARMLRESGVPDSALRILPNTVSDVIAQSALGSDVAFLGRLEAAKGVDLLLRAWDGAAVSGRQLHLYGDGPLRALAEQAAGVVCHGVVSKEEVALALESAALVVVPSVWDEPFGRTVIEAYAHGRPVIATRTGALPELVDHHTGWLVPPETAALRSAIELALGDARELERRGQAARLRYERDYAPDAYVRRFVALYQATADQM